ncbi:hypothetical protein QR90_12750 [Deinococcus radiopugnans]|uniref:Uncharacterized protein n=1 Tax=Deinococcus radiopugnans TaxID=57497 RepID=A0A0A7KI26_9DEIO|nr:hypothetical protein QR90_12750 [Deinococcus radiopugnans]
MWSGRPHGQPRTQLIQESDEVQAALEASGHRLGRGVAPGDVGATWVVRDQTGQPGGHEGQRVHDAAKRFCLDAWRRRQEPRALALVKRLPPLFWWRGSCCVECSAGRTLRAMWG